jgi:Iron-containing redox enzyme
MQSTLSRSSTNSLRNESALDAAGLDYGDAEQVFCQMLATDKLDQEMICNPSLAQSFQSTLNAAITRAFAKDTPDNASLLFLQRILYRINRLNLFWYDDLENYSNERSLYIAIVRDRIESAWQSWELSQIDILALQQENVREGLIQRADIDLEPPLSNEARFIREEMSQVGYRHLLAIASFDGLVEASRLSRILGGAANEVQCTLVRVLLEEYGNGRLPRKHSTFFAQMMAEMGLNTEPEGYFEIVPWEVLASINHNFLLTECKRHFLRYNGGLTYFEVAGPSIYQSYLASAQRLNLSETAMGYWELHIREDERHGKWMLEEVALPLAEQYHAHAWELLLGYDQEKFIGERAGAAVIQSIRNLEGSSS